MEKQFYLLRRKICRWIMSFDTCPACYRKNFRRAFLEGLTYIAAVFGAFLFFVWIFLAF